MSIEANQAQLFKCVFTTAIVYLLFVAKSFILDVSGFLVKWLATIYAFPAFHILNQWQWTFSLISTIYMKPLKTEVTLDPRFPPSYLFLQSMKMFFSSSQILSFGCPTANFGPLSREKPHWLDVDHCVFICFDPKVTRSLITRLGP